MACQYDRPLPKLHRGETRLFLDIRNRASDPIYIPGSLALSLGTLRLAKPVLAKS
jgi:hypothetical protein